MLTSNGVLADPSFQAVSASGAITTITGNTGGAESPTAGGNFNILGTGSITVAGSANTETVQLTGLTNHNVLVGAGTATITNVAPSTAGFVLTSNGAAADPSFQHITGQGLTWQNISASQTLAVNNGYQCTGGAALSLLLPATSAIGDIIEITLDGSTSWTVTQAAGQAIRLGSNVTTGGAGGSLASTAQGDTIRIVCSVANLRWNVISMIGNITIV